MPRFGRVQLYVSFELPDFKHIREFKPRYDLQIGKKTNFTWQTHSYGHGIYILGLSTMHDDHMVVEKKSTWYQNGQPVLQTFGLKLLQRK